MNNVKIALVDDHSLLRSGLASIISNLNYTVLYECSNGLQFIEKVQKTELPDLVLMDINMPELNGYDTTLWLKKNMPDVKVLALSMYDDENAIIRMIRNGARGYILKDTNPKELTDAINSVIQKGFYYSELVSGRLIRSIQDENEEDVNNKKQLNGLNEKELLFLKLAGSEMTYKEVANAMHLSPRTIDGYRDGLFQKLNIKSRVGLVLFAIKNGIIHLN